MNSSGNSSAPFLKENNVGGIVALPPTSCLRTADLSACAAARVECTGSAGRPHSQETGPMGPRNATHGICPREQFQ